MADVCCGSNARAPIVYDYTPKGKLETIADGLEAYVVEGARVRLEWGWMAPLRARRRRAAAPANTATPPRLTPPAPQNTTSPRPGTKPAAIVVVMDIFGLQDFPQVRAAPARERGSTMLFVVAAGHTRAGL